jgi:hypothetical protein
MDDILGLRAFVPSLDFERSKQFYERLGFAPIFENEHIAILKQGTFSFVLQRYYQKEFAENCMLQLLVRDVEAWWQRINSAQLMAEFAVRPPQPPALQSWGLKVGFLFDPSGVLWHISEVPK